MTGWTGETGATGLTGWTGLTGASGLTGATGVGYMQDASGHFILDHHLYVY